MYQLANEALTNELVNHLTDYYPHWHEQCKPHRGQWSPYDHIHAIHGGNIKNSDYVIIAKSNAFELANDENGLVKMSLQALNKKRYDIEYERYLDKLSKGEFAREPVHQKNIQWVQAPVNIGEMRDEDGIEAAFINEQYTNGYDAYVCMSSTWSKTSRRLQTISSVNCVWLDLDLKDQEGLFDTPEDIAIFFLEYLRQEPDYLPLPSAIVQSGGGIHIYWLTDPIPIEAKPRFDALMEHLHKKVTGMGLVPDPHCTDAPRVLRLCKTRNSKYQDSTCELLWRSNLIGAKHTFDNLCDAILPYTREEYKLLKEQQKIKRVCNLTKMPPTLSGSNRPDGFKNNVYEVILSDLQKLALSVERFRKQGFRHFFLWNYGVALTWVKHIKQVLPELKKICIQMSIDFEEFRQGLNSIFTSIENGRKTKLSVPRMIKQLAITDDESLDLNLRVLRSKAVKTIHKRLAKAEERKQLTPALSRTEKAKERFELVKEAYALFQSGLSKAKIAREMNLSERTVYRYLSSVKT